MTARTFAQYPDHKILEHCRCITLDDLLIRGAAITDSRIKTLSNALKTASAHECTAHLMEWPDGVLACIVSSGTKSLLDVTPAAKITAYRKAVACGDVVFRNVA
jgi:hypothetical protein